MTSLEESATSLLQIAELVRGVTYKRQEARPTSAAGYVPVLRATNIQSGELTFDDLVYVPAHRVAAVQRIRRGDIVLAMSSGSRDIVGKAALAKVDWDGGFGAFCGVLRAKPGISSDWLAHFLQSPTYRSSVNELATGSNINNLSKSTLAAIQVLPARPEEQAEAVALLDRMTSSQRSTETRLQAAQGVVHELRRSVLAAAAASRFADAESKPLQVSELVETLDQGWSPKCLTRPADNGEWGVIKTTAVQGMKFAAAENKALPDTLEPRPALELQADDVLITRAGPRTRVGVACVVPSDAPPRLLLCDKVYRVRVDKSRVLPEFLELLLNSNGARQSLEAMKTGTSESGMNLTQAKFMSMEVRVPPLQAQRDTVAAVRQLLQRANTLDLRIASARKNLGAASQAILSRTFPKVARPE